MPVCVKLLHVPNYFSPCCDFTLDIALAIALWAARRVLNAIRSFDSRQAAPFCNRLQDCFMRRYSFSGRAVVGGTFLLIFLVAAALVEPPQRSQALPVYARRYDVPCEACHTVVPALNATGLAFQANHFNWPGGPPRSRSGLALVPVSAMATYASFDNLTARTASSNFENLQVFLTDGFRLGRRGDGGYFIDDFADIHKAPGGVLGDAFVSIPVAGPAGQLAITMGQFTPISYQYDPLNDLTESLPATLANAVDGFAFADPQPGVRLDYFSNPGQAAGGDYVDIGVAFRGLLALNDESDVQGPEGVYLHAFRRPSDSSSVGVFGFANGGDYIAGAMGTCRWQSRVYLLAAGQVSHDRFGHSQIGTGEADYMVSSQLALIGRLETEAGEESATFPVFGVTYYPFRPQVIRLAAETTQERANRSMSFYVIAQF